MGKYQETRRGVRHSRGFLTAKGTPPDFASYEAGPGPRLIDSMLPWRRLKRAPNQVTSQINRVLMTARFKLTHQGGFPLCALTFLHRG